MRAICTAIMAIIAAAILVIPVGISTFQQQQVYALRDCAGCADFRKLTSEFVQNVINNQQSPNSENVTQFRILTAQFENDVINAVLKDNLSQIPRIVSQYANTVIVPTDVTDLEYTVPEPSNYIQEVLRIFCKPCI